MPFRVPTVTDIIRAGAVLGLDLTNAEAHEYLGSMERLIESYKIVDGLSDERPVPLPGGNMNVSVNPATKNAKTIPMATNLK